MPKPLRERPERLEMLPWLPEPSVIQLSRKAQVLGSSEAGTPKVKEIIKDNVLPWRKQAEHTERGRKPQS